MARRHSGRILDHKITRIYELMPWRYDQHGRAQPKPRRVVAKFECHPRELSPRVGLIVTIRSLHNELVLAFYDDRGTANARGSMSPHGTTPTFSPEHF